MNRNKMLSFIIVGSLFGSCFGLSARAEENNNKPALISCGYNDFDACGDYEMVSILGDKYDLSHVDAGVLLNIAKMFDQINRGVVTGDDANKLLSEIKSILDGYEKDPDKYKNMPTTLEFGPANELIDEVRAAQEKISSLKQEQESIKMTKMVQQAIDEKVEDLQDEIDDLVKWINYSIFNFNSDSYVNEEPSIDVTKPISELMVSVYSNDDFDKVFQVVVTSDGGFTLRGDEVSKKDLYNHILSGLEYENLKAINILKEIEMVKNSRISEIDQQNRIKELGKQLEDVKAYSLSQEIVLLNLKKDALKLSRVSQKLIDDKTAEINELIQNKVEEIKNHSMNSSYIIKDSNLGTFLSYSGYLLRNDNGAFAVKVNLDASGKVFVDDGSGENTILDASKKNILKELVKEEIKDSTEKISDLNEKKQEIESEDVLNKYYLLDALNKKIDVLNNNIENFNTILSNI